MPEILPESIQKVPPDTLWTNIKHLWETVQTRDTFTKASLVIMAIILFATPFIISQKTNLFTHASRFLFTNCIPIPKGFTQMQIKQLAQSGKVQWCQTISYASSCIPRPACLDAIPRCNLAEPVQGWCTNVTNTPVPGNTYYVSQTGSDTNAGTQTSPWRTLQKAENTASTGDTVEVAAGTYIENDPTFHAWAASKGISWIANGSVTVESFGNQGVAYIQGNQNASFNGFTFEGRGIDTNDIVFASGTSNKTFTNDTFTGTTSTLLTIQSGTVTNISIYNSALNINAPNAYGVLNSNNTNFNNLIFTGNTINAVAGSAAIRFAGNNNLSNIQNNNFKIGNTYFSINITGSGTYKISQNSFTMNTLASIPLNVTGGSGTLTITSNTFSQATNAPVVSVKGGTYAVNIDNNNFTVSNYSQKYSPITITNQTSPQVSNNTFDMYATDPVQSVSLAAIWIASYGVSGGKVVIKNNTIKNRNANGYSIFIGSDSANPTNGDGMLDNATITNNTIYGYYYFNPNSTKISQTHGIFVGHNINALIQNNVVNGSGYGVVLKGNAITYTSGGVFSNTFYNCLGGACIRIKGVKNVNVSNNAAYNDKTTAGIDYRIIYVTQNNPGEGATGAIIKNNVLHSKGIGGSDIIQVDTASINGFTSDYNNFYLPSEGNICATLNNNSFTFPQLQNQGYDTHSIFSTSFSQTTSF